MSQAAPMKQYLLTIMQPDGDPPPPEVLGPIMRNVNAFNDALKAAGAWVFAGGLNAATTATVIRSQAGQVILTDGPYTEGKEHVGGLNIIQAPDLDAALEWGRKLAQVLPLPIEVRPFREAF